LECGTASGTSVIAQSLKRDIGSALLTSKSIHQCRRRHPGPR